MFIFLSVEIVYADLCLLYLCKIWCSFLFIGCSKFPLEHLAYPVETDIPFGQVHDKQRI